MSCLQANVVKSINTTV